MTPAGVLDRVLGPPWSSGLEHRQHAGLVRLDGDAVAV